jgi:long-chain acyl-CoA synthetase
MSSSGKSGSRKGSSQLKSSQHHFRTSTTLRQAAELVDHETLLLRPWLKSYEPGVPPDLPLPNRTLGELLRDTAAKFPDKTAIYFYGNSLTYREVDMLANRFASGLVDIGVKPGDKVALHLPNCPQFVIAYYGALRVGAIIVPCNPTYVERELEQQLNDSGAQVIVTLTMFFNRIKAIRSRTALQRIIVGNIKDYFPPRLKALFTLLKEKNGGHRVAYKGHEVYGWLDFLEAYPSVAPEISLEPDDVAVFGYTGGTTGVPKAAMLTHRNLITNAEMCHVWSGSRPEGSDVCLSVIPFFHSYGMTVGLNSSVALGTAMVLLPKFEVIEVLKAIVHYHPNLFPGVPAMYIALLNAKYLIAYNLNSVEICLSGASPLHADVQSRFEAVTGAKLVEGFGMTECSPVSHSIPIFGKRMAGSIGVPLPGMDAKIMDLETGETELASGEIGELVIKGPTVMKGYYNRPDETARTLRNGWLYTGDIAKMDEDGFFYIVDRKKDMILSNGFNVYPRDVEEVLFTHPAVKEAVVIGAPNERGDTTVKAFVILRDGMVATSEEIIEFCRLNLARYKAPRAVEFRDSLPKTLIGKPLRRVLVEEEKQKLAAKHALEEAQPHVPIPHTKKIRLPLPKIGLPLKFGLGIIH